MDRIMHPSQLAIDELWKQCRVETTRRGGPGGQHRNKVETAVIVTHQPSSVSAEANERRSQSENREVAFQRLRIRLAYEIIDESLAAQSPTELWLSRVKNTRIVVSPNHNDFAALIAESLAVLHSVNFEMKAAATQLRTSPSQLVKLFGLNQATWNSLNRLRSQHGLPALRST